MKPHRIWLRLATLTFAANIFVQAVSWAAGPPQTQPLPSPTVASILEREIAAVEKQVVDAAEAMPEEKFNFTPENLNIPNDDYKGVRTFALQVKHIAASNYFLWSSVTGDKIPDEFKGGNGPDRLKTKTEIVNFLKDSFALGHKAAAMLTTENMLQNAEGSKSPRLYFATFAVSHAFDHYGQMVEYLRMNGIVPPATVAREQQSSSVRVVDLKASDGTALKATYFAAAKPGPGVLLLHQGNRERKAWDDVAAQLAAAGINTLTLDLRGFGGSGGTPHENLTHDQAVQAQKQIPSDIDVAWQYLASQSGVTKDVIGLGGAGVDGVDNSVQAARRHPSQVKSMVLLSGETLPDGLQFLRQASQIPELFVVADNDEYPPTVEAMELLYINCSSPSKRFVRYPGEKVPWLGFEDRPGVPATGSHGTDMFKVHPELPGMIVHWFVTTLIKTPGQAPNDLPASPDLPFATIIQQIETPGGTDRVAQQLTAAREKDPGAQLWPEAIVTIIGYDHLRAGENKQGIEVMKLNVIAYPQSADAHDSLSDAYFADGQKDMARKYAEKALALLASDTTDSERRRAEIRDSAQQKLNQLGAGH